MPLVGEEVTDDEAATLDDVQVDQPDQLPGGRPKSEITGQHDEGEATPTKPSMASPPPMKRSVTPSNTFGNSERIENTKDIPVFDRGRSLPKI